MFLSVKDGNHQFAHAVNSPVFYRKRNGYPTVSCLEKNIAAPYIFGKIIVCVLVIIVIIATQVGNNGTKKEHRRNTCKSFGRMAFHLSSKVCRTLNGCIPKHIAATTKSRYQCTGITSLCLPCTVIEFCSAAFLVEVYAYLLCIIDGSVNAPSHFTRCHESGKTGAVLDCPVAFIKAFTQPVPCFFYRNLAVRFFQFPAYVVLMLFNVPDIGIACFSSVHHELMKHCFRLVAHVKRPFAVLCQELLYPYRVGIHIIAMKTQCVVRAFPYPGHGIGV